MARHSRSSTFAVAAGSDHGRGGGARGASTPTCPYKGAAHGAAPPRRSKAEGNATVGGGGGAAGRPKGGGGHKHRRRRDGAADHGAGRQLPAAAERGGAPPTPRAAARVAPWDAARQATAGAQDGGRRGGTDAGQRGPNGGAAGRQTRKGYAKGESPLQRPASRLTDVPAVEETEENTQVFITFAVGRRLEENDETFVGRPFKHGGDGLSAMLHIRQSTSSRTVRRKSGAIS